MSPSVNTNASLTKKTPVEHTYTINEMPLESCDTKKDLGVWTNKRLNSARKPTKSSAFYVYPKLLNASHIVSFHRPVPFRLRNLRMDPTVPWFTKESRNVQRHPTKQSRKLPFRCDVTYKTCLRLANLLPMSYLHEVLDITLFYKAVNNLVFIDSEALSVAEQPMRSTRSSSSNSTTFIKRGRTVIYQRSFSITAYRIWNVLPSELHTSYISLASFRRSLLQKYIKALDLHDVDDITTWKKICPGCNIASIPFCARRRTASSTLNLLCFPLIFSLLYVSSFSY